MWIQQSQRWTKSLQNLQPGSMRPVRVPRHPQEDTNMVSKTMERRDVGVPIQKDPDVLAAAARLAGEDLCSIADLSSGEVRAILKLGHDVKRNPREYRTALDAKQMVLMFEKASLRTRLSFETGRSEKRRVGNERRSRR